MINFQQIQGVWNLSFPFIMFYLVAPDYALSTIGMIGYALYIGLYIAYLTYSANHNLTRQLIYRPTNEDLNLFKHYLAACNVPIENINIRYAFAGEGIALTRFNTITMDPIIFEEFKDDSYHAAREIVETHILPTRNIHEISFLEQLRLSMKPTVQEFIFKHELGHVTQKYTANFIAITSFSTSIITLVTLLVSRSLIQHINGYATILISMALATFLDICANYLVNIFFKTRYEKLADKFACAYSSKEVILDAADFFEKYESHATEYRKNINAHTMQKLPRFLFGHLEGTSRAKRLRELAKK